MSYPSGVYVIENTVSGRRYVGSAVNLSWRWTKHQLHLNRGTHHSRHLQNAWNKYGSQSFRFRPILFCSRASLLEYEQRALDALRPEYNVCKKAGSCLGVTRSEEFKKGVGDRRRGKSPSEATRRKISESLTGRKGHRPSKEQRQRMSEESKTNAAKLASLAALAEARRGVPRPPEVKAKLGRASASLTDSQVLELRRLAAAGQKHKRLSEMFGISQTSVSAAVNRKTYGWVS